MPPFIPFQQHSGYGCELQLPFSNNPLLQSTTKIFLSFPPCTSTHTKMFQLWGVLLELGVWGLWVFLVRRYTFCWFSQTRSPFHFLFHRKIVTVALKTNTARDELVQTRPYDLYWQEGAKPPLHICPLMKFIVTSLSLLPTSSKHIQSTAKHIKSAYFLELIIHTAAAIQNTYPFCQQAKTKSQNPFVTLILVYCNSPCFNV